MKMSRRGVDETLPIATTVSTTSTNRGNNLLRAAMNSVFVGVNNNNSENGESSNYVEFGRSSNNDSRGEFDDDMGRNVGEQNGRTLGTFAGVFSPVALSMFSALIFIRVGFIVGNAGLYITLLQFLIAYLILLFTVASVCAISTNGAIEGGGVYFMISRTLGLEFGGSIGTLFFLANVVGCAMAIAGCTEGIMNNFGLGGYFVKESQHALPDGQWWRFFYCTIINTCMLLVCLIGAALFAKTSVVILGIVSICLFATFVSFLSMKPISDIPKPEENKYINTTYLNYTGLSLKTLVDNLDEHYGKDYTSDGRTVNFSVTFGVLFAGVTGIMAGANMSGELKNPAKSIPLGTLSAVGFTFISYIILSFLMSLTTPFLTLQNNFLYLMNVNFWPPFTAIGILTATFSTGLSNLIGSSRILEALSKDQVFGNLLLFVLNGTWNGNPVTAVVTSWILVECILLIGSFNIIAQINSVLFMLSYLATNLACLCIELTGAPNFRPLFKYFSWHTCLIGLIGTLTMMFVINPIYASLSIILCLLLVIALHLFSPATQAAQWGSISQALMFHQVRKYLLMLDPRKDHVKFWRPQMLLLVSTPRACCPLVDFVNDMKKGGLYVIGHVELESSKTNLVEGSDELTETEDDGDSGITEQYKQWLYYIDHMHVKAFAEVTLAKSIRDGIQHLIRLSGIGAMKPNTIILGFYDDAEPKDFFLNENSLYKTQLFGHNIFPLREQSQSKILAVHEYVQILGDILKMKKNLCICRHFQRLDKVFISRSRHLKYIDVWPINIFNPQQNNANDVVSQFMMQLATIINMLAKWKHLQLRIFLCDTAIQNTQMYSEQFQMQHATTIDSFSKHQFEKLLKNLRIVANIIEIDAWSKDTQFAKDAALLQHYTDLAAYTHINDEIFERSMDYMQHANEIIRSYSNQTAISFIYLPKPPTISTINAANTNNSDRGQNFKRCASSYINLLSQLTDELPPTIMVHGVSTVTSTTL